ncbi:gamma-secretase subunit PEN-2 [Aphidius gifuensis]|uniref:gamma-secretase subunit PEN-2 n=1 Tax=Aphidius gifuensis TaxID=684658 RepID=UPI001CDC2D79|nr:gamma-secretase subunit PEN-2 [Aphidius gifuensis]
MDLSKMTNEKKLYLCRWYFRTGFALLPFLWAVNSVWFFKEAFVVPAYEEQKEIKKYVVKSAIGAILCFSILFAWVVIFQTQRAAWGEFGDSLSYIIPEGIP